MLFRVVVKDFVRIADHNLVYHANCPFSQPVLKGAKQYKNFYSYVGDNCFFMLEMKNSNTQTNLLMLLNILYVGFVMKGVEL